MKTIAELIKDVREQGFELVGTKMAYAACDSVTTSGYQMGMVTFHFPDGSTLQIDFM